ncbi:ABC transporter substrate-binding protein [Nocardia vermiculata]|uniref:ABC transporter substrate-binding protein n=1 Tax=Nocardia vermiculata TaxID=257274 RepID=A0A846Y7N1_9NOCA|nr:ABC transporter substrate-binding protein [Nocardia vermiculata]NKY54375.1 ABC transporter substrate-binding protein [Nocardia vermiculata]
MKRGGRACHRRALAGFSALVLLGALGATACSSDNGSNNDAVAGAATTVLPDDPATDAPVKVGFISTEGGAVVSLPEMREGAQAAVEYLNKNGGGLAGHSVDLVVCKQQEEPTSATKCANELVEQKVAAVLSPGTSQGAVIVPIVAGAGIPYITLNGVSQVELTSPESASLSAGLPGTVTAMAQAAKKENMKSFTLFASDGGGIGAMINAMGAPIFQAAGVELKVVPIALGVPDPTPLVTSGLSSKPDGVSVIADAATCTSVYKAIQTTDPEVRKVYIPTCLDPAVTAIIGMDAVQGSIGITATDYLSDRPDSVLYRSVLQQYAPKANVTGAASSGYQIVMALAGATANMQGQADPAGIAQALKTAKNVEMPAGGGVRFTCDGTAVPQMSSICSRQMLIGTINDQGVPVDLQVTG